jgi:hypothetical protein
MSGSIAVGSLVQIGYIAESTYGVTPASAPFQEVRDATFTMNLAKETYQSEERRSDRMRQDVRHGYRSAAGDITGELSSGSWDDFIQAVMGGGWSTGVSAAFTSVVANSGTSRFTVTSANFPTMGVRIGDVFAVTGTPAITGLHDRLYTALSVGVSTIEVEPGTIGTTVTGSCIIAVAGRKLSMGNTYRSFTIERWLTDRNLFQQFRGVRVNQVQISAPASGMVRVTFGLMGQDGTAFSSTTVASGYVVAPQTAPYATVFGELYEGATVMGFVTSADITLNNNMAGPQVVGRETTPDMLYGRYADITGTITVLFTDATMHEKFVNETESSLILRLQDRSALNSSTAFLQITMPRIKYTGADMDDSPDTGITLQMPFTALKPLSPNTTQGTSAIVIQRGNVS